MIEGLMPPGVVVSEAWNDPPDVTLPASERALLAHASDKRRREFTTGRHCARDALTRLGVPLVPVLTGPGGEPLWPDGVVGSITHCAGYRAAAVARCTEVAAIGIDAEPHEPLPDGVAEAVTLPGERSQLAAQSARAPGTCWDRLLFSAKESIYKVWYPHAHRMLGFDEARVTLDPDGTFRACLLVAGPVVAGRPLHELSGRWSIGGGLVLTAITVAERPRPPDVTSG
jgi:4'-phosphopantetheinyl transferase EntD